MHASACAANASLSSTRSMSSIVESRARERLARGGHRARAPCTAGSTPADGARRRCARAAASPARSRRVGRHRRAARAAPSLMPDELPAVTVPSFGERGLQLRELLERGVRARVLVAVDDGRRRPSRCGTSTGTISSAKRPRGDARAAARCWLCSANASWSSRDDVVAARRRSPRSRPSRSSQSAPACCGLTKRQPSVVSAICGAPRAKAVSRLEHHARRAGHALDAAGDEAPRLRPPRSRARRCRPPPAPSRRGGSPSGPGTRPGSPASSSAMRATLRLSSPAWLAQPRMTSSIGGGVDRACARAARGAAPRRGRRGARAPARRRGGRSACGRRRR